MIPPAEIEARLERVLLKVQKPGRYVGGEVNAVVKDWEGIPVRVALVFPDIYDIGVSNIGLKILADQVNQRPDALAERACLPWVDMEAQMRERGIPLYSLETRHALADFDLLGFTLPYETLYTNLLDALDLAGLPLLSAERDGTHPLVIAGGHACFNPEPMHAFVDAFVIGEGEEAIHEVIDVIGRSKQAGNLGGERSAVLKELAKIPGVYVPRFYAVSHHADGTVAAITPNIAEAPQIVQKRICAKLPPPPTNFIVPNIEIVHNRVTVEIMRGCTRGCRFCHAGMVARPVRERSVAEVLEAAEKALAATGFEELALLSLSSSDYTHILELVKTVSDRFRGRHLTVSLPSLRIESVSVDLMEALKDRRSSGFTLAPEAATERMRRIINKFIPDEQILATTREIYARGWTNIKLYFMIGHPSETLEDVQAIADLCRRVLAEGRRAIGGRAKVHAGVSTFVPKPHTPFQWTACDTVEQIEAKISLLKQALRDKNIKLTWNEPQETLLEAFLSRGDRRMAQVILGAWRRGAKFDAWQDQHNGQAWAEAFNEVGLEPSFYTHRPRPADEVFPWEHISTAVRKQYLYQDYLQSQAGETRPDCREQCYACGILPTFNALRRENPGEAWKCPEVPRRRKAASQAA
ncbi:MAG: TIGR03960 family B12-binding radical SAM protein [Chloroflexi bacterium]|nr:TIGR03960 family B12-binding radical SAM protein [Chloroflexota bacterium]